MVEGLRPLPAALFDGAFDEVDNLGFQTNVVERIDFLHAGRAGDVHLGEIVTDNIQTDKIEPILTQARCELTTDFAVARRDLSLYTSAANVNVAAMLVRAWHP